MTAAAGVRGLAGAGVAFGFVWRGAVGGGAAGGGVGALGAAFVVMLLLKRPGRG